MLLPCGEVRQEGRAGGAAVGLALSCAAAHGGAGHRHPRASRQEVPHVSPRRFAGPVMPAVVVDVDVPPQRRRADRDPPPRRARELRAEENVDMPEPAEDIQQGVVGQSRPVSRRRWWRRQRRTWSWRVVLA